jgi:capsular polysaccharide transport system permease protein
MNAPTDITALQEAVVTRLDPPAGRPLIVGADEDGWSVGRILLLVLLFLLPAGSAAIYFGLIAADIYVADSQFVVRSQGQSGPGMIEGLGEGAGIAVGAADVNSVISYIGSRDALEAVSRRLNLREAYGAPHGDVIARFPGLFRRDTAEDLFTYFQRHVKAEHDKGTGVTTLTVSAFDPLVAQSISRVLLEEAERIVNGLTERMRRDTLTQAEQHVAEAGQKLETAQQALQDWRAREKQYDPALYSKSVIEVVTSLSIATAEAKAKRQEVASTAPRSPDLPMLDRKIETLQKQIEAEWLSLAGENQSLAPLISEYERRVIDRDLAVKLYAAANESLERTRAETRRQSVFVERISEPPLSDKPLLPRRILYTLIAAAIAFMAFLVVDRLAANVRRHRRLADYVNQKGAAHG